MPLKRSCKKEVEVNPEPSKESGEQNAKPIEMLSTKKRKSKGSVTMEHLQKRKFTGNKLAITYNSRGQAYGKENTWLQSFLGGLVQKIPITYTHWLGDASQSRNVVPQSKKDKICEQVEGIFDLGIGGRKSILSSCPPKFQDFKYRLFRDFILPFKDDPEALAKPPLKYTYITDEQWHEFVKSRLGESWQHTHRLQSLRRAKNEYDHRLSRNGYVGLEQEMDIPGVEELDRSVLWLKGREDKQGNILDPKVAKKAKEIEELNKQVEEGSLEVEISNDVLTMALGKPEHCGRVIGVGKGVTPSSYFNLPKNKRDTVKEIVSQLGEIYEAKTQELLRQERVQWQAKLDVVITLIPGAIPSTIDGSAKASCSKEVKPIDEEPPNKINTLAKGSCNQEGEIVHVRRNDHKDDGVEEIDDNVVYKKMGKCGLAIECPGQIIANAYIVECDAFKSSHVLSLKKEEVEVQVYEVLDEWAKLPLPMPEKYSYLVSDANDIVVHWPKDLVVLSTKPSKGRKERQQVTQRNQKEGSGSLSKPTLTSLKLLSVFVASDISRDYMSFQTEKDVFGYERKTFLLCSDIERVANLDEITANYIVMYIRYLYGVLEE